MKKKVMHIICDLTTAGAQMVVMNYLRGMKNDPEFEIIAVVVEKKEKGKFDYEVEKEELPVFYCNYEELRGPKYIRKIINWIRYQRTVSSIIKKEKPDIIHTHITGILPLVSIPIILSGIKGRVHTLHSDPRTLSKFYVIWAKVLFKVFKFYPICVTDTQCEIAKKIYDFEKCSVVNNAIPYQNYKTNLNKKEARELLGISSDFFVVGYAGRLHSIKNIDFLINLFCEYLRKNEKTMLVLAGDGPERKHLQTLVERLEICNKVKFLGVVDDIAAFYKALDLFMITSFYESSSIVTVEAQLSGCRCLISDNIPEQIVVTNQVNRLSLDEPLECWISAIDDRVEKEKKIYDGNELLIEHSIDKTKIIYNSLL